ncbi:hypothetical protein KXW06_002491 [Aspergillus fumigatus]|nr:hypothetical protein KXW06_002491 [Aspergillus fumigatus]
MPGSWFTEGMDKTLNININDSLPGCHDMSSYHAVTVSSRQHLHISRQASLQSPSMLYEDLPETYFAGHSGRATNMNKVYSQTYIRDAQSATTLCAAVASLSSSDSSPAQHLEIQDGCACLLYTVSGLLFGLVVTVSEALLQL